MYVNVDEWKMFQVDMIAPMKVCVPHISIGTIYFENMSSSSISCTCISCLVHNLLVWTSGFVIGVDGVQSRLPVHDVGEGERA